MPPIRVLVVDDSVVIRKLVGDALGSDPDIEVVGSAANGSIALAKITQLNPDVLTLDVEMPVMDGLETLRELKKTHPALPVIMFSTLTERGATATLEALALGARDYVTKPANVGSVAVGQQRIREELIPRIKALCSKRLGPRAAVHAPAAVRAGAAPIKRPVVAPGRLEIVAIGVSTGGPNALAAILPVLPADFAVPILIVQHMPPLFTKLLADRLRVASHLDVREATAGMVVERGGVYLAPGNFHMKVRREHDVARLTLTQDPPENSCRPAVDPLFRSVAETYGARALGVILTGMGQDGLRGCQELAERGAPILAQDQATSVVWGMPGFVVQSGLADKVLPLDQIASEIVRRVNVGRALMPETRIPISVAR